MNDVQTFADFRALFGTLVRGALAEPGQRLLAVAIDSHDGRCAPPSVEERRSFARHELPPIKVQQVDDLLVELDRLWHCATRRGTYLRLVFLVYVEGGAIVASDVVRQKKFKFE